MVRLSLAAKLFPLTKKRESGGGRSLVARLVHAYASQWLT